MKLNEMASPSEFLKLSTKCLEKSKAANALWEHLLQLASNDPRSKREMGFRKGYWVFPEGITDCLNTLEYDIKRPLAVAAKYFKEAARAASSGDANAQKIAEKKARERLNKALDQGKGFGDSVRAAFGNSASAALKTANLGK